MGIIEEKAKTIDKFYIQPLMMCNAYDTDALNKIFSCLIHASGQYADSYNSDIIIDINAIKREIKNKNTTDMVVAIRPQGVDGNSFFESRMSQTQSYMRHYMYRKIYLLRLNFEEDETIKLYDITHDI